VEAARRHQFSLNSHPAKTITITTAMKSMVFMRWPRGLKYRVVQWLLSSSASRFTAGARRVSAAMEKPARLVAVLLLRHFGIVADEFSENRD